MNKAQKAFFVVIFAFMAFALSGCASAVKQLATEDLSGGQLKAMVNWDKRFSVNVADFVFHDKKPGKYICAVTWGNHTYCLLPEEVKLPDDVMYECGGQATSLKQAIAGSYSFCYRKSWDLLNEGINKAAIIDRGL